MQRTSYLVFPYTLSQTASNSNSTTSHLFIPLHCIKARDIIRILFPVATVVTPNIPETMAILQLMSSSPIATAIETVEDMEVAAKGIYALGPAYVLLKGGHLAPSNTTGQC